MSLLDNTQINSADGGEAQNFPSQVDQPPPPQREIDTHTSHKNFIDTQLYFQNIFKTNVLWSTTDPAGKLLAFWQLHPEDINPLIAYLSPLYHAWKGSMTVVLRVMGSAFHAGLLACVALPPDVHPSNLVANKAWTAYNWQAIDPKCQSMIEVNVPDINQGMFHYTDNNKGLENNWRGGWFACYVDSQLNTTTSGTPQINVEFWCKPSSDFRFSYLRLPKEISVGPTVPADLHYALHFQHKPQYAPSTPYKVDMLRVLNKSIQTSNFCVWSCHGVDGAHAYKDPSMNILDTRTRLIKGVYKCDGATDGNIRALFHKAGDFPHVYSGKQEQGIGFLYDKNGKKHNFSYWGPNIDGDKRYFYIRGPSTDVAQLIMEATQDLYFMYSAYASEINAVPPQTTFTLQTKDESFITFQLREKSDSLHMQTHGLSTVLSAEHDWVPTGMCALFRVVNEADKLPLFMAKLYPEGYFTTHALDADRVLDLNDLAFHFEAFVVKTAIIPHSPEMARNSFYSSMKQQLASVNDLQASLTQ